MKTLLVLSMLLCAAFAAPAEVEEKAPEAGVEAVKEQMAAVPEMENKMRMASDVEALVPEDSVPVPGNARFNICPDGWFNHGSRCFLFVNSLMTWYNAEEHCNTMGAHLASATNPREYSFLQQITKTAGQSIAWLGGFYLQGTWMWIDREGFYYMNFEPSTHSSSYPCVYLRISNIWGKSDCSAAHNFICSKDRFSC